MKSIREMSGRLHELMIALDKAGFTPEKVSQIINAPGNKLAIGMHNAVFTKEGYELPVKGIENNDFSLVFESKEIKFGADANGARYAEKAWQWKRRDDVFEAVWGGMKARLYSFGIDSMTEDKITAFANEQHANIPNKYGLAIADLAIGMDLPKDKFILGFDTKDRLDTNAQGTPVVSSLMLETTPSNVRREEYPLEQYGHYNCLLLLFFEREIWEKW
jgi:hypothetical protein